MREVSKEAENVESQTFSEKLFECSPDAIVVSDAMGRIIESNQIALRCWQTAKSDSL